MNFKNINPAFVVYIAGIVLLGLFCNDLKQALGGKLLFFSVVIGYLLVLRLIGHFLSKSKG